MNLKFLAISLLTLTINSSRIYATEKHNEISFDDNPFKIMQHFHESIMKKINNIDFFKNYENHKMLTDVKQKEEASLNIYT